MWHAARAPVKSFCTQGQSTKAPLTQAGGGDETDEGVGGQAGEEVRYELGRGQFWWQQHMLNPDTLAPKPRFMQTCSSKITCAGLNRPVQALGAYSRTATHRMQQVQHIHTQDQWQDGAGKDRIGLFIL